MSDVTWNPAGDDDTSFGPLTAHNVLGGRTAADAHPAAAVSYDNDVSGLTGDTVQEAIDELATSGGAVASVNGETGVVVLDAGDVGAVPVEAVGLLPGETNRGTWDIAATYAVGDVVFETGSDLYIATAPSTGDQPSLTPGSWDVLDPTGRHIYLGPGATAGDYGLSVGYGATAGDGGTSVGLGATSGDFGTAVGLSATAGDNEVNLANTYRATLDPGDPTVPLTATIATGHVDLPETADVTNPPADHQRLIARTDGLYVRDETGTEVGPLGAGGGGGIPETIIDAAGDLIVGTAADTAARLAVGTSGQVLTSNGTTAAWAMPWTATHAPTITATAIGSNESCVYSTPGQRTAYTSHGLTGAGAEVWVPVPMDAGTYDRISVYVTAAAVSTWRIGLDTMATNGKFAPGANTLDAGTLNMNTGTGHQALTISLTIPTTGIYWARVLCTAFTASPTTVNLDGNSGNSWASMVCRGWPSSPASYLRGFVGHVGSTGGTGAFTATPVPAVLGTVLPVVYFRRAS